MKTIYFPNYLIPLITSGTKTQTRRFEESLKILNNEINLQRPNTGALGEYVASGYYNDEHRFYIQIIADGKSVSDYYIFPKYFEGETIMIAQSYRDILIELSITPELKQKYIDYAKSAFNINNLEKEPGYKGEHFDEAVIPELMIHSIEIKSVTLEPLYNVRSSDIKKNGIYKYLSKYGYCTKMFIFYDEKSAFDCMLQKENDMDIINYNHYAFNYNFKYKRNPMFS